MCNGRLDGVELVQAWFYERKCGEGRPEGRKEFPEIKIRWKLVGDQPGAWSPGFQPLFTSSSCVTEQVPREAWAFPSGHNLIC